MTICIVIIGCPNAGKSTLFNHLTGSRDALVADQPGVTRDLQYGRFEHEGRTFLLVDTGGLYDIHETNRSIAEIVSEQSLRAVDEADAVFWLVDGRAGLTSIEENLAAKLRRIRPCLYLLVNKTEGLDRHSVCADFHKLGVGDPMPVSARRGSGIAAVLGRVMREVPEHSIEQAPAADELRICIIGRPNAGKSTLVNRMLGEERMLTWDEPGTTRDSISIPFQRQGKNYQLVDTAGIRRRARVTDKIEKFSIVKSLEAIESGEVILLVMDATEGITEHDLTLLGMTAKLGKSLLIAINKWDGLDADQKRKIKNQLDRKLEFAAYACIHFISALHGTGVGKLFVTIEKIRAVQTREYKPSKLTDILEKAVDSHPPPAIRGRRIKLRYAHLGGHNPLRVIIHGNQTEHVPESYQRYLANTYHKQLKLTGTPVQLVFKTGDNPYKDRKNILSDRQVAKRRRLIKHVQKKK
jgi:GTP-binding protein